MPVPAVLTGPVASSRPTVSLLGWPATAALMFLLYLPLAIGVLWLAATERVPDAALVWNADARAVCIQGVPCSPSVVAVRSQSSARVAVDADLLLSAGHFLPAHAQRDDYYGRHDALDALLAGESAVLEMSDGTTRPVAVGDRGVGRIGWILWVHLLFAGVAWASGLTHAIRRPGMQSGMLALSSVGYAIAMPLGGMELVHGLGWPQGAAREINGVARAAVQFAFAGYLGFVLCLPRRFVPAAWLMALPGVAAVGVCIDQLALAPAPVWGHQFFMALWALAIPVALFYQWHRTRSPLIRALAQWFALGALLLAFRLTAIQVMAASAVAETELFIAGSFLVVKTYSLAVMLASPALSLADGALRRAFLWVLAGLLLVVADSLLVLALSVQQELAFVSSLALMGWLYMPLRAWVFGKLLGRRPLRMERHVDDIYATARSARTSPDAALAHWRDLLCKAFEPEAANVSALPVGRAAVLEDGAALWAPLAGSAQGVVLRHSHGGRRLFATEDRHFVDECAGMLQKLIEGDRAADVARREERQRIANDLHDDLGGRLMHMARGGPGGPWSEYAQQTLAELRLITHGMAGDEAVLHELAADLRAELMPRITQCGLKAQWHADLAQVHHLAVRAEAALAIARILSEAVRNAVTHAGASAVDVTLVLVPQPGAQWLELRVANDGGMADPSAWAAGLGMRSIQRRAARLGGQAQWSAQPGGGVELLVRLSLAQLGTPA